MFFACASLVYCVAHHYTPLHMVGICFAHNFLEAKSSQSRQQKGCKTYAQKPCKSVTKHATRIITKTHLQNQCAISCNIFAINKSAKPIYFKNILQASCAVWALPSLAPRKLHAHQAAEFAFPSFMNLTRCGCWSCQTLRSSSVQALQASPSGGCLAEEPLEAAGGLAAPASGGG